jgi:hypothetical protein
MPDQERDFGVTPSAKLVTAFAELHVPLRVPQWMHHENSLVRLLQTRSTVVETGRARFDCFEEHWLRTSLKAFRQNPAGAWKPTG